MRLGADRFPIVIEYMKYIKSMQALLTAYDDYCQ